MAEDYPPWLEVVLNLRAKLYQHCESHSKEYNTYCTNCNVLMCELCRLDYSEEHDEGHQVLQVYKASGFKGFKIDTIKKLIDISGIQPYVINSKHIVFINERERKGKSSSNLLHQAKRKRLSDNHNFNDQEQGNNGTCGRCGRELLEINFKFCSIECKVASTSSTLSQASCSNNAGQPTVNSSGEGDSAEALTSTSGTEARPKKLSRRKQLPRRSPLM